MEVEPASPVAVGGSAKRRSPGKVAVAGAAVVALLGAGAFAVSAITGNDDDGGAATAQEVGERLVASLGDEDVLGVVDLLLPGERDAFRQPLLDLVDHLTRLGVADDSADLADIGGLDIAFDGVKVTKGEEVADDIVDITVSGTSTTSVDGKEVPIGDLLIDEAFDGERPDLDAEPQDEDFEWHLTTVKRDGRFYLSLFYSLAESLRPADQDVPDQAIDLEGATQPEGAVDNLLGAVSNLDVEGIIANLDPGEAEALQRYAPLFLGDAQNAIDDSGFTWEITDTEYTVSGSGDRRSVNVDALTITATDPGSGDDVVVTYADGCATVEVPEQEPVNSCDGFDSADQQLDDMGIDSRALDELRTAWADAFSDFQPTGVAVHQVGGKWFVSPVRTGSDMLLGVLGALDKDEIHELVQATKDFYDSLIDLSFEGLDAAG